MQYLNHSNTKLTIFLVPVKDLWIQLTQIYDLKIKKTKGIIKILFQLNKRKMTDEYNVRQFNKRIKLHSIRQLFFITFKFYE